MSIEGFDGNGTYNFRNGEPLTARCLNELATSADTSRFTQNNIAYAQGAFGTAMSIDIPYQDTTLRLEQFQIVVEPYEILGSESFSIIRVVKGEVVWRPELFQDNLPVPNPVPTPVCTTQTTIENWFALPTFPIIDDENATFIGDGGIRVPNVAGVPIGIFIFKVKNLLFDVDPIIVASPDFVPTCPVVPPNGIPTYPSASPIWDVVKIGSVEYVNPDPGAEPPIAGGWTITQNLIGSLTLPGGGASSSPAETAKLPAQLPSTAIPKPRAMPFECRIEVDSGGDMLLKIGNGTVSYARSNMPWVGIGSNINRFQVEYDQLQVCPTGWKKQGNGSDGWMALGGGYKITGEGQWYLCAAYWDAREGPNFTLPDPAKPGRPFVALIDAYGADVDKLFVETGPGLYTNTMNVQKMSGYTSEDTGEAWDWGYCHTTYFNPMKLGYDIKMIARIESKPADQAFAQIFVSQTATEERNQIQNIYFPVLPKDGFVVFSYDGFPSLPFYPSPWSGVNNATDLFNALQAIPALVGNIEVTRTSDKNFYVTFINALQATDCPLLVANNSGLESWPYEYVIDQYHLGNLVLDTTPRFDGTQMMNKANMTSAEDPYVIQSNNNPAFDKVINREDLMACTGLSGDNDFTSSIIPLVDNGSPRNVTQRSFQYGVAAGCSGQDGDTFPYRVYVWGNAEGAIEYAVDEGMLNNVIPSNIDDVISLPADTDTYIYVKAGNTFNAGINLFPDPADVTIEYGSSVPEQSNDYCYILIAHITGTTINQIVKNSLWGDRIKVSDSADATYYIAGV
jgi:hypothetical protein